MQSKIHRVLSWVWMALAVGAGLTSDKTMFPAFLVIAMMFHATADILHAIESRAGGRHDDR